MSCNWCQDGEVAHALIRALCGKDSEAWKQESNSDLCFCTPCVREYHRWKNELVKESPECEEILYAIEEGRLRMHFMEVLNQEGNRPRNIVSSDFPHDVEDYLKVPILEMLQYPYLLFNRELMTLFVNCSVFFINNGKFQELDRKLPGVYLLLFNPCLQLRKWALKTAKEVGTISLEDFHRLSPIINCMLKVILYGLNECHSEAATWPVPMTTVDDDTQPQPHLFNPLPKKDLWLSLGVLFNAMEENVLMVLLSVQGHCQVLAILKNVLEDKDPESEAAFWGLLFCLKVFMSKLESTFWLLASFDDAPNAILRAILSHSVHAKEVEALASKTLERRQDENEDEISLSQLVDKHEELADDSDSKNDSRGFRQPFFWMLPYIITVIDLEVLNEEVTCDVVNYLLSLVTASRTFWSSQLPSELDYSVLTCLCDILNYLIGRKLSFLIKNASTSWVTVLCFLRFSNLNVNRKRTPKRWTAVVRKAHSVFSSMLKEVSDVTLDADVADLLLSIRFCKPSQKFDSKMMTKLKVVMPKLLQNISELNQRGLPVSYRNGDRKTVVPSGDCVGEEEVKSDAQFLENPTGMSGAASFSNSPIYITDSEEEDRIVNSRVEEEQRGASQPISREDDCEHSEEQQLSGPIKSENLGDLCERINCLEGASNGDDETLFAPAGIWARKEEKCTRVRGNYIDKKLKRKKNEVKIERENSRGGVKSELTAKKISETIEISDSDSENFVASEKRPVEYQHGEEKDADNCNCRGDAGKEKWRRKKTLGRKSFVFHGEEKVSEEKAKPDDDIKEERDEKAVENLTKRRTIHSLKKGKHDVKEMCSKDVHSKLNAGTENQRWKGRKTGSQKDSDREAVGDSETEMCYSGVGNEAYCLNRFTSKDEVKCRKRKKPESENFDENTRKSIDDRIGNDVRPAKTGMIKMYKVGNNAEGIGGKFNGSKDTCNVGSKGTTIPEDINRLNSKRIPHLEKRSLFDFIGEIRHGKEEDCEMAEKMSVSEEIKGNLSANEEEAESENGKKMEQNEEKLGVAELAVNDDRGDEAVKNVPNEDFQIRKDALFNQFVKKKMLNSSLNEAENSGVDGASTNATKDGTSDTRQTDLGGIGKEKERAPPLQHERLPEVRKHKQYSIDSLLRFILSWHPVWMESERQDELSIALPCEPRMIQHKYDSYDEYMYTIWPLILIEFFAQMSKDYKEKERHQLDYKFKSSDGVVESHEFRIVQCESLRDSDAVTERDPCENDLVILRCADEHITEVFGVVEEVERTFLSDEEDPRGKFSFTLVSVKIRVAKLLPTSKISSLQMEIVTSMVSLYRRWEALIRMPKSLLAGDILNPFRPNVFELANGTDTSQLSDQIYAQFNKGQCNAISKITEAVVQAFPLPKLRLLQGPPGTGKTHTLKGLVKNIMQSLSREGNSRILICAASNAAVDEIASRLKQDPPRLSSSSSNNNIHDTYDKNKIASKQQQQRMRQQQQRKSKNCGDVNILRVGSESQINPKVTKLSLEYLVKNELAKIRMESDPNALKSEIHKMLTNLRQLDKICTKLKMSGDRNKHNELKKKMAEREHEQRRYETLQKRARNGRAKRDMKEEEKRLRGYFLTNADIICCTLSGAGSKHMVNTFRNEWNIRNGTPFACVIIDEAGQCCEPDALIPLQYGSSKLVLVGDPAQLPAAIFSKRALRYGYGQSMFERIQAAFRDHSESPVLMLQEQYRMHPAICAFPSQTFYDGNLLTAREVVQRRILVGIKPTAVLNIVSSEERSEQAGAIHNPEERRYVTHVCREIVKRGIAAPENIGVITPYRKQLRELRNEMNDGPLSKVEVNTIDGFQGREKDIIILSCVRAQKFQSGIGFLEDAQRMNVALTRAKHSLILFVHAKSLQVGEDWKALIDFARSRQLLFDISSVADAEKAVFVDPDDAVHGMEVRESVALPTNEAVASTVEAAVATPLQYEALSNDESGEVDSDKRTVRHKRKKPISGEVKKRDRKGGEKERLLPNKVTDGIRGCSAAQGDSANAKKKSHDTESAVKVRQSPRDDATRKAASSEMRKSKLPHVHSDGTKCAEKCLKVVAAQSKLPHVHSDGTRCVDRCLRRGERSKPSSAYFRLPHDHIDGTRCVERCIRLEEREKQRRDRERGVGRSKQNAESAELQFNYLREDIAGRLVENVSDIEGTSCPATPESLVGHERETKNEEGGVKDSRTLHAVSVSREKGSEATVTEEPAPVTPPSSDGKCERKSINEKRSVTGYSTTRDSEAYERESYQGIPECKDVKEGSGASTADRSRCQVELIRSSSPTSNPCTMRRTSLLVDELMNDLDSNRQQQQQQRQQLDTTNSLQPVLSTPYNTLVQSNSAVTELRKHTHTRGKESLGRSINQSNQFSYSDCSMPNASQLSDQSHEAASCCPTVPSASQQWFYSSCSEIRVFGPNYFPDRPDMAAESYTDHFVINQKKTQGYLHFDHDEGGPLASDAPDMFVNLPSNSEHQSCEIVRIGDSADRENPYYRVAPKIDGKGDGPAHRVGSSLLARNQYGTDYVSIPVRSESGAFKCGKDWRTASHPKGRRAVAGEESVHKSSERSRFLRDGERRLGTSRSGQSSDELQRPELSGRRFNLGERTAARVVEKAERNYDAEIIEDEAGGSSTSDHDCQRQRKNKFREVFLRDIRVLVPHIGIPSNSQKRGSEITEISPRKVKRAVYNVGQAGRTTKIDEISQRIRARNASRCRPVQLLDSAANFNGKS